MSRHAAFASGHPTEIKEEHSKYENASLAPTGTRITEKSDQTGSAFLDENPNAVRKLLLKLGERDIIFV